MKKLVIMLFGILFLSGIVSAVITGNLGETCVIDLQTECKAVDNNYIVMGLSSATNAHAELANQGNYNYGLCCGFSDGVTTCIGDNTNKIIGLSSDTNAHGEINTLANYGSDVCYGINDDSFSCAKRIVDCAAEGYPIEMLSLSADTNAHVSSFDDVNYPTKVCCEFLEQNLCDFKSAEWRMADGVTAYPKDTLVDAGTAVKLYVDSNNACAGASVSFVLREADCIDVPLVGEVCTYDDVVSSDPASITISEIGGSQDWTVVWEDDTGGIDSDAEYVFEATMTGSNNDKTLMSQRIKVPAPTEPTTCGQNPTALDPGEKCDDVMVLVPNNLCDDTTCLCTGGSIPDTNGGCFIPPDFCKFIETSGACDACVGPNCVSAKNEWETPIAEGGSGMDAGYCGEELIKGGLANCFDVRVCYCKWNSAGIDPLTGEGTGLCETKEKYEVVEYLGCRGQKFPKRGICNFTSIGGDTCADDGFLSYSWTGNIEWDFDSNPGLAVAGDPAESYNEFIKTVDGEEVGGHGWDNKWHYDPTELHSKCVNGKNTIRCPGKIKLPFFGLFNIVLSIALIGLIYGFILGRKK